MNIIAKYTFWSLIVMIIAFLINASMINDQTEIATELIKTLGLVVGSGAAGYGIGKKQ